MRFISHGVMAAALACAGAATAAPSFHEDGKAGVRFPIPFARYEEKTAAQVTALVLADPRVKIPAGIELTSGVYDESGTPFLIVWQKAEAQAPTQKQALDLAGTSPLLRRFLPFARGLPADLRFDASLLRGVGSLRAAAPLKGRAAMQLTKEGEVFLGLFYKDPKDAALLEQAAEGLAVLPGRGLRYADLAPGGLSLHSILGLVGLLLTGAGAGALLIWRRQRGARGTT